MKGSGEKETEKGTHNMARAQDVVAPRGQKVKWRPYNRGQRGGGGGGGGVNYYNYFFN